MSWPLSWLKDPKDPFSRMTGCNELSWLKDLKESIIVTDTDSNELPPERGSAPRAPSARKRGAGVVIPAEGAYDPKLYQDLKVPPEMENIFQYIMK